MTTAKRRDRGAWAGLFAGRCAAAIIPLALATTGATQTPEPPPVPVVLASHIVGGAVAIDDFGWMRGRFPGASDVETERFAAAIRFAEACGQWSRVAMRARLAALGQALPAGNDRFARPAVCRGFEPLAVPDGTRGAAFAAAVARVRPYAIGIVAAVTWSSGRPRTATARCGCGRGRSASSCSATPGSTASGASARPRATRRWSATFTRRSCAARWTTAARPIPAGWR